MKAAVYYQPGGPEVFRYEDVPDPGLPPDGLLVRVEAISVEGGDTLHRAAGELATTPHVVGYQAAGTVLAVGDQVSGFVAGERVVTVGTDGSHASPTSPPETCAWSSTAASRSARPQPPTPTSKAGRPSAASSSCP